MHTKHNSEHTFGKVCILVTNSLIVFVTKYSLTEVSKPHAFKDDKKVLCIRNHPLWICLEIPENFLINLWLKLEVFLNWNAFVKCTCQTCAFMRMSMMSNAHLSNL